MVEPVIKHHELRGVRTRVASNVHVARMRVAVHPAMGEHQLREQRADKPSRVQRIHALVLEQCDVSDAECVASKVESEHALARVRPSHFRNVHAVLWHGSLARRGGRLVVTWLFVVVVAAVAVEALHLAYVRANNLARFVSILCLTFEIQLALDCRAHVAHEPGEVSRLRSQRLNLTSHGLEHAKVGSHLLSQPVVLHLDSHRRSRLTLDFGDVHLRERRRSDGRFAEVIKDVVRAFLSASEFLSYDGVDV
mmetsp:Transcript_9328/g.21135  ORF Transcript_9328/g.21135 Transcript_9328/m.21135 type:complete len:251 (+) Transcript_9328:305-1057(+)